MLERELKLSIPASSYDALHAEFATLQPSTHSLQAIYFDSDTHVIAKAHAALRIRLEDTQWVQTLKLAGPDELSTLEFNHHLDHPTLNLELYKDVAEASFLFEHAAALRPQYRTDVRRHCAVLCWEDSTVELALDTGHIHADEYSLPICEIEFELKTGDISAVFELAKSWLEKYQLIIELRSKSERGTGLVAAIASKKIDKYSGQAGLTLARRGYRLPKNRISTTTSMQCCYASAASAYLSQIIRNAAFLSLIDGIQPNDKQLADYLSMMRVGMRRLRSCRRLFYPWMTVSERTVAQDLRHYFSVFGEARDDDLLALEVLPTLLAASLPKKPPLPQPALTNTNPSQLASSSEFQLCLLRSLQKLVLGENIVAGAPKGKALHKSLHRSLKKQFKQIKVGCRDFKQLSHRHQHRLRNHIKTLRYNLELLGNTLHKPLHDQLRDAQRVLGAVTDTDVALSWCKLHIQDVAQRHWALGWLHASRHYSVKLSAQTLYKLESLRYPKRKLRKSKSNA